MTICVKDYPIFAVGTWNKMEFTVDDLRQIAATFRELAPHHQVPLKLGHDQPELDGQPAMGWVENLRVVGENLIADFCDIPSVVVQMMRKNAFRKVSVELIQGLKYGGKVYKYFLDAVAILGSTRPAVTALPDLNQFLAKRSLAYDEGGQRVVFERQADEVMFEKVSEELNEAKIQQMIRSATLPLQIHLNSIQRR